MSSTIRASLCTSAVFVLMLFAAFAAAQTNPYRRDVAPAPPPNMNGGEWGEMILEDYRTFLPKFWVVKPKAAELGTLIKSLRQAA